MSIISARGAILMETKDDSWKLGEDTNQYKLIVIISFFSPECQIFCMFLSNLRLKEFSDFAQGELQHALCSSRIGSFQSC